MTNYISDIAHYNEELARVAGVKHSLVIATADHFNSVWSGEHCKTCKRKAYCGDRIK